MDTFVYYVLVFYLYAFIGWFQEVLQVIVLEKRFVNRGFLIGPLCPVYGFGGMLITLYLTKYYSDPMIVFFSSVFICAVLEYFTSWSFEKVFKARWWDYTNQPFNVNGRICLIFSLLFGVGAMLIIYFGNPFIIDNIVEYVPSKALTIIVYTLLFIQAIDMIISFSIISKLKNISNSIRSDNTEQITKEVKKRVLNNALSKRLLESYPKFRINNSMSLIKQKIIEQKNKYVEYRKKYKEEKRNKKRRLSK